MIEIYTTGIKRSLENKCYFSALASALTLPDMCGMAEYPKESSVAKRYIDWYNKYIEPYVKDEEIDRDNPWLSGEVIYNLRNTFLHQGVANIKADKVKEKNNKLDDFVLILGDGTVIQQASLMLDGGYGEVTYRTLIVDVTYLCDLLCGKALWYYQNNKDKFEFGYNAITIEEFLKPKDEDDLQDIAAKIINKKLEDSGSTMRVVENPEHNMFKSMRDFNNHQNHQKE